MDALIYWGNKLFSTFDDIGDSFLFSTYTIPGFGDVSLVSLVVGSGVLLLLSYIAIKFVVGVFT